MQQIFKSFEHWKIKKWDIAFRVEFKGKNHEIQKNKKFKKE